MVNEKLRRSGHNTCRLYLQPWPWWASVCDHSQHVSQGVTRVKPITARIRSHTWHSTSLGAVRAGNRTPSKPIPLGRNSIQYQRSTSSVGKAPLGSGKHSTLVKPSPSNRDKYWDRLSRRLRAGFSLGNDPHRCACRSWRCRALAH